MATLDYETPTPPVRGPDHAGEWAVNMCVLSLIFFFSSAGFYHQGAKAVADFLVVAGNLGAFAGTVLSVLSLATRGASWRGFVAIGICGPIALIFLARAR